MRLQICHQQRRGSSFAGDIANHKSEPFAPQCNEIVIIAANCSCRQAHA